jgi:hypothetical protein
MLERKAKNKTDYIRAPVKRAIFNSPIPMAVTDVESVSWL